MLLGEPVPTHMGADQRRIDVDHLRSAGLGLQTGLDRSFADPTEPLFAPVLADARQA